MSLLAIPSALRYKKEIEIDTRMNVTRYKITLTSLGENRDFMTVYTWIQNALRSLIPLIVLIVLNALIISALRKQRVKGKKQVSRNRVTVMLITVIIVFLICITPDALMSTIFEIGYAEEDNLGRGIREYTDLLLAVNSAVNFIIYCACSKLFRQTFVKLFFLRCGRRTIDGVTCLCYPYLTCSVGDSTNVRNTKKHMVSYQQAEDKEDGVVV